MIFACLQPTPSQDLPNPSSWSVGCTIGPRSQQTLQHHQIGHGILGRMPGLRSTKHLRKSIRFKSIERSPYLDRSNEPGCPCCIDAGISFSRLPEAGHHHPSGGPGSMSRLVGHDGHPAGKCRESTACESKLSGSVVIDSQFVRVDEAIHRDGLFAGHGTQPVNAITAHIVERAPSPAGLVPCVIR